MTMIIIINQELFIFLFRTKGKKREMGSDENINMKLDVELIGRYL